MDQIPVYLQAQVKRREASPEKKELAGVEDWADSQETGTHMDPPTKTTAMVAQVAALAVRDSPSIIQQTKDKVVSARCILILLNLEQMLPIL
jgi:hypothetical protein